MILCLLAVGMLTNLDILISTSAILMVIFIAIMLPVSLKTEGKYFKKK